MSKKDKKMIPNEVRESANKIWLAGLGALATAEEEGGKLFRTLVEKGETFEAKGRERVGEIMGTVGDSVGSLRKNADERISDLGDGLDDTIVTALRRLGVPSREEIATLNRRIEELAHSIESLKPATGKASKSTKKSAEGDED